MFYSHLCIFAPSPLPHTLSFNHYNWVPKLIGNNHCSIPGCSVLIFPSLVFNSNLIQYLLTFLYIIHHIFTLESKSNDIIPCIKGSDLYKLESRQLTFFIYQLLTCIGWILKIIANISGNEVGPHY